ncbi:hypothetical protein [Chitinophaga sp.]|uniref:hypothetical protein n=1 Tax=Chitinophaga sp. TaxID=1869181 RepID=UPI002F954EA7
MELPIILAQDLLFGYSGATLLFLMASLFYAPFRQLKNIYLSISNIAPIVIGILLIIAVIWDSITTIHNAMDVAHFRYYALDGALMLTFIGIIPLIFLKKKYRKNVPLTLVVVIFQYIGNYYYLLLYFITSFSRDSLPSSWAYYRSPYVEIICWPLGYFVAVLLIANISRRYSPNPTAASKY